MTAEGTIQEIACQYGIVDRSPLGYVLSMVSQPPSPSSEIELLRRQSLFGGAQATSDLAGDLLKWTLGALLAVNGGALIALLGADELRAEAFKEAAFFFGGGMLCALIGGICWTIGLSLLSADGLKRAWNPEPLEEDALASLKTQKATGYWLIPGSLCWIAALFFFVMGCISTAFVPQAAEFEKLATEAKEGAAKFVVEAEAVEEIMKDDSSTAEQRQAARDRARAARIEAKIRLARLTRALGEPDDLLPDAENKH
ncbi:MAG: hypothetical protein ABWX67_12605 [Allosphingosinicella sp.]